MELTRDELSVRLEKAVLVSVALPNRPWLTTDPLEEIEGLATTAGAVIVGGVIQKRPSVHPGTYIGRGKLAELKDLVAGTDADVVIFDNDLSPAQVRNLEQATGVKVLDRSELILDIFATRAQTHAARLAVELAQLEYAMPRLKQMWSHLSRLGGGGIGTRGPGETQLEEDRRLVGLRIRDLKAKLAEVQARKEREVRTRNEVHTVSLVGYTNAGKSTLMNALTGAGVLAQDKLFSTLDTRTRQWPIKDFGRVLLSDTVGFIRDLPHHLVASFKATLEEARQAKLLLHVVDASSPVAEGQIKAVKKVLKELECDRKPTLLVLNKVDAVADRSRLDGLMADHPRAVCVSARSGFGLDGLRDAVITALTSRFSEAEIVVPAANGRVMAYLGAHAEIIRQSYEGDTVRVRCLLPKHLLYHVREPGVHVEVIERPTLADELPGDEEE